MDWKLSEKAAASDFGRCGRTHDRLMAVCVDKHRRKRTMHENRNLQDVRTELEYIPICHDPFRRVYVSGLPSKAEKAAEVIAGIINIGSSLILSGSCAAMVYLVARMI